MKGVPQLASSVRSAVPVTAPAYIAWSGGPRPTATVRCGHDAEGKK